MIGISLEVLNFNRLFVILMKRRHLDNKTFFCVSQTCHTKEGEQYTEHDIQGLFTPWTHEVIGC